MILPNSKLWGHSIGDIRQQTDLVDALEEADAAEAGDGVVE